ncbi:MotA/TolQ/ExbB proton channel family protein [Acuticoccus yangtzensis]|uniref:MotA/TolQ/ExbB proton channel family protein n=1 Tax=Acuticoccus yangtzensis TaxID=1443441 RepID=UPI000A618240|nr:MotA/TolQ/ExbB proton channel family protein [Acuticoccus yangtzensis]
MDAIFGSLGAAAQSAFAFLVLGGPVVALLLLLAAAAACVAGAKALQFSRAGIGRHERARQALTLYGRGETGEALRRAAAGHSLSAAVVRFAIEAAQKEPPAAARDGAETYAVTRLHGMRRHTGVLDIIAQISPLLGLFGTVLGMIEAFKALEGAGAAVDPSVLAGGIWVALLTTAVGLGVAMPASVLASWFEGRLEDEEVALGALIAEVFNGIVTGEEAEAEALPPRGRKRPAEHGPQAAVERGAQAAAEQGAQAAVERGAQAALGARPVQQSDQRTGQRAGPRAGAGQRTGHGPLRAQEPGEDHQRPPRHGDDSRGDPRPDGPRRVTRQGEHMPLPRQGEHQRAPRQGDEVSAQPDGEEVRDTGHRSQDVRPSRQSRDVRLPRRNGGALEAGADRHEAGADAHASGADGHQAGADQDGPGPHRDTPGRLTTAPR